MKMYHLTFLLLHALLIVRPVTAVTYRVYNDAKDHPGGRRFQREVGEKYCLEVMPKIHKFIIDQVLQQRTVAEKRRIDTVNLHIAVFEGYGVTQGDHINISAIFYAKFDGNMKWDLTSLLYHEMTHVFQWITGPRIGIVEGIADYTVLKANYAPPYFAKPGQGEPWDKGYDVTARFFEYLQGLKRGFVGALNNKMRDKYDDKYFVELTGKPVEQLWKEYKAQYRKGYIDEFGERDLLNNFSYVRKAQFERVNYKL